MSRDSSPSYSDDYRGALGVYYGDSSPDSSFRGPGVYGDSTFSDQTTALLEHSSFMPYPPALSINYGSVAVSLVRIAGRNRIAVVPLSEISRDPEDNLGTGVGSLRGASMQVYRGQWGGRKVVFKYMRTQAPGPGDAAYVGQRYKEALVDVLHEVNVMSYPPLCQHRNITKLIGLSFDGVQPVLIVEPAHESFPDLGHFFNPHHNQTLPNIIPFELAASLIADIADGMAALHSFCVTNADLKPGNILIFSDDASPTGLIAKISDFGMAGIDMPLQGGGSVKRAGPSTQTRGGTTNWVAPECQYSSDKRQHEATRDIYTFGLLATYIALGGRHPTTYSKDLWRTKVSDTMVETAVELLKAYCSQPGSDSRLSKVEEIARATLRKEPEDRIQSLNGIRKLLFDYDEYEADRRDTPTHMPMYTVYPVDGEDATSNGFHDTFWKCSPEFRDHVREAFRRRQSDDPERGIMGQYIHPEVCDCITIPPGSSEHVETKKV